LDAYSKNILYLFYKTLKKYINKNGTVILSYSTNKREGFVYINPKFLQKKFLENGFKKVDEKGSFDGMNRNIRWLTQIYKKL